MSILVQAPQLGLNTLLPANMLDPREAAWYSENMLYENGMFRTAYGWAKVDLTTTGLNSEPVLSIFPFKEFDDYAHMMAVTNSKIYEHDRSNSTWTDRTGDALDADMMHPISHIAVASSDVSPYYHLIVCDGGNSDIQRWAGRSEDNFTDLLGAGDYHDGTTHRARHVGQFQSRLILLSPLNYQSSSGLWTESNQRVQWPVVGKLQTWTGTGSGFTDLIDTGGTNLWAEPLGGNYIIYQTRGIWTLGHVGGTAVFSPYPYIPDIGLLAPNLMTSRTNIHYFVGTDYNVYAYYGGTAKERIGDKIQQKLFEDINPSYVYRCKMSMDRQGKMLWIFIVTGSNRFVTRAYGYNFQNGSWTIRDLESLFTESGISAVGLVEGAAYEVGQSYSQSLLQLSLTDGSSSLVTDTTASSDLTVQYGEEMCSTSDNTTTLVEWTEFDWTVNGLDFTGVEFSTGGNVFAFTTRVADVTEFFCNTAVCGTVYSSEILRISDGSDSSNTRIGTTYWQIGTICSQAAVGGGFCVRAYFDPLQDTTKGGTCGWADASTTTPSINNVSTDTTGTLFCPSGTTYRDDVREVLTQEELFVGDATGFVYQFDVDETYYSDSYVPAMQYTPVFDLQQPDIFKRWKGISFVGKGTSVAVQYRVSHFDTSETGWVTCS